MKDAAKRIANDSNGRKYLQNSYLLIIAINIEFEDPNNKTNNLVEHWVRAINRYSNIKDLQKDNNYMKGCSILCVIYESIEAITTHILRQLKSKLQRKTNTQNYREVENATYCSLE